MVITEIDDGIITITIDGIEYGVEIPDHNGNTEIYVDGDPVCSARYGSDHDYDHAREILYDLSCDIDDNPARQRHVLMMLENRIAIVDLAANPPPRLGRDATGYLHG